MKNLLMHLCILSMLCLFGNADLHAQTEEPESLATKIKEATRDFEAKVKELERKLNNGEIDREDFEDAVEEAADDLEDAIEDFSDSLDDMFEDDDDQAIEISTDSTRNKVKISLGDKKGRKRTKSYLLVNFGPTYMLEGAIGASNENLPEFAPWKSWSTNLGLIFSTRIGGSNSIYNVNYGLQFKFTSIEISSDHRLTVEDGNPLYVPPSPYASTVSKSELRRYALVLPVQLRLAGAGKNKLNVMLGGYGGIRLNAFQDLEFKTAEGEKAELRLRDDYATNLWQYGVTAAIGQRWWQLYADYELSNLFEDNPNYEYNMLNAGVQFFF